MVSRSFRVIDVGTLESLSAVLVMMSSKFASICNRSLARLVDSSRNRAFWSTRGGLVEPSGSKLTLLKSMFNAENFIRRLSWSISSDFDAVQS